jgi:hypothetical protein
VVAAGSAAPLADVRTGVARPWAWRSLTLLRSGPTTFPHPYVRRLVAFGSSRDRPGPSAVETLYQQAGLTIIVVGGMFAGQRHGASPEPQAAKTSVP